MSDLNIVALVSVGAHPASGRARRAEQDARAVELGLRLGASKLRLLHAGDPSEEALRGYLGMGPQRLEILQCASGVDALPLLAEALQGSPAQLVLTGSQAETGEGSGLLPFLLAERLGWPMVVGLVDVERVVDGWAEVLQALPRGQRRRLRVRLPCVASVDSAGPLPRQSAFGPARRGALAAQAVEGALDPLLEGLQVAKPRPKRLKVIKAKTAADRFKAATAKASGDGGQQVQGAEAGAEAIFKLLQEEGVLR